MRDIAPRPDSPPNVVIFGNFSFGPGAAAAHCLGLSAALIDGGAKVEAWSVRGDRFTRSADKLRAAREVSGGIAVIYLPELVAAAGTSGYGSGVRLIRTVWQVIRRSDRFVTIGQADRGGIAGVMQAVALAALRRKAGGRLSRFELTEDPAALAGRILAHPCLPVAPERAVALVFGALTASRRMAPLRLTEAQVLGALDRLPPDDPLRSRLAEDLRQLHPILRRMHAANLAERLRLADLRSTAACPTWVQAALAPSEDDISIPRIAAHLRRLGRPNRIWRAYVRGRAHPVPAGQALAAAIERRVSGQSLPSDAALLDPLDRPLAQCLPVTRLDCLLTLLARPLIRDSRALVAPWMLEGLEGGRQIAGTQADPGVEVIGQGTNGTGLAQNMRMSLDALHLAGIAARPLDHGTTGSPSAFDAHRERPLRPVALWHLNADRIPEAMFTRYRRGGPFHIGFLLWELDRLPREHELALDMLDEIWVPSRFLQDVYAPQFRGQTVLIRKGFDLPSAAPWPGPDAGVTRFLTCFDFHSSVARKNPLAAVTAFRAAFPRRSDVELVVKTTPTVAGHWGDPEDQMGRIRDLAARDARIRIIEEDLPFASLLGLIASADCVISPHRAEGFGYIPAYALAMRVPVVSTDHSGTQDFCTPETSFPIPADLVPVPSGQAIFDTPGARWAEIDREALATTLRDIAANPDAARARAAAGQALVRTVYSKAAQAGRYRARLGELGLLRDARQAARAS